VQSAKKKKNVRWGILVTCGGGSAEGWGGARPSLSIFLLFKRKRTHCGKNDKAHHTLPRKSCRVLIIRKVLKRVGWGYFKGQGGAITWSTVKEKRGRLIKNEKYEAGKIGSRAGGG